MFNLYIDAPCLSMGGVEFFSVYTGISLYKKGFNVYLVESVNNRNMPNAVLEEVKKHVPLLTTEQLIVALKHEEHDRNIVLMSWNQKLYEVLHDYVLNVKNNAQIIAYSHSAAVYYYDALKLYEPIISKFICVSKTIHDELVRLIPARKSDILYQPCPTSISLEKKWNHRLNETNEISILFVGRMEDASKGIFRLVQVYDTLIRKKINFKLRIVGKGIDSEALKSRFREKFGDKEVRYEFIENANTPKDVLNYMKISDVLIVTSNFEGGPIVVYEAMSCMVVPVSFRVGNISSIIENGVNGFITDVGDLRKLTDHIIYLYENPDKRKRMAEKAYESITQLNYLQDAYDSFLVNLCIEIANKPFTKNFRMVKTNLDMKRDHLNFWVKKIIPENINKQYQISNYLNECESNEKRKHESHFNKIIMEKEKEINTLKEEKKKMQNQLNAINQNSHH